MRALLLAGLLALGLATDASAHIRMAVDATSKRGQIDLYGIVGRDMTTATFYEVVGGRDKRVADVVPAPFYEDPDLGPLGFAILRDGAQWRCDRRDRTFAVVGQYPDGATGERSVFSVRTPSCRHRLAVKTPRRVRPGGSFTAKVRDTFGTGRVQARVCLLGRCKRLRLAEGQTTERMRLKVRKGRDGVRTLRLATRGQRLEQSIAVGVRPTDKVGSGPPILITGDSLMQSVDAIVSDRFARAANVISDVRLASALSRSVVVDFPKLARQQVREHKPAATAIFLGANDFWTMVTPEGNEVFCCDEAWGNEYERRARGLMRTYAQKGTAAVAWLAVPYMRDTRRTPAVTAVNAAIRRAAATVPGAFVVPVDELVTPGGVFRPTAQRGGRDTPIREDDGIHLTIAGARIVVAALVKGLKKAGVLQ